MSRNGFGKEVDRICKEYGLNNKTLAERCGIDPPTATRIRKGDATPQKRIQLILQRLPEDEITRARLQMELMLDYLALFGPASPLINVTLETKGAKGSKKKLNRTALPTSQQNAYEILMRATLTSPELAQSIESLAQQILDWGLVKKYPDQKADVKLVASPKSKKYKK